MPVLRPAALVAVGVLLLNDHVLKRVVPSALTGKLSDLAGLFFFPLLLASFAVAVRRSLAPRSALLGSVVLTGIAFAVVKIVPALAAALGAVPDPTDLVALAMLPLAFAHGTAPPAPSRVGTFLSRNRMARLGCLLVACTATVATSPAQGVRRFPYWEVGQPRHAIGGAAVHAWVSKSGREGFGLSVDIESSEEALPVEIDVSNTVLRLAHERIRPVEVVPARAGPGEQARGYLAFRFANRRAWNDGVRTATLRLGLKVGHGRRALILGLTHTRPHPHGKVAGEVGPLQAP